MTIYEIAIEWLKLTMSLFLFLAVPFSLYMIWDMVVSDISMTARIYNTIGSFAINNLGFYLVVLSIIVYLTYLSRLDLKKEEKAIAKQARISESPRKLAQDVIQRHLSNYQERLTSGVKHYLSTTQGSGQKDMVKETLQVKAQLNESIRRRLFHKPQDSSPRSSKMSF